MKQFILLVFSVVVMALTLQSCGVNDTTPDPTATVESHFFPLDNGLVYTYIRYNNLSGYDTLSYRLVVAPTLANANRLVNTNPNSPDSTLYYISYEKDATGHEAAVLATANYRLLALAGDLHVTDTWRADIANGVTATVEAHYDDYYLPGRSVHFSDVIAVKYHQSGAQDNVYTLRFFARGHGLILERQMYGPNTEIASLQLLSVQYPIAVQGKNTNPNDRRFDSFIFANQDDY